MSDVVVRLAVAQDLLAVAALRRAWTEEEHGEPVDDPTFEVRLADWSLAEASRRVVLLAVDGDVPVGMVDVALSTLMPRPGAEPSHWAHLSDLYVLPGHRDGDAGERLVDVALTVAGDWGCTRVVVAPGERSVPLYERAGFGPATMLMARTLR